MNFGDEKRRLEEICGLAGGATYTFHPISTRENPALTRRSN